MLNRQNDEAVRYVSTISEGLGLDHLSVWLGPVLHTGTAWVLDMESLPVLHDRTAMLWIGFGPGNDQAAQFQWASCTLLKHNADALSLS